MVSSFLGVKPVLLKPPMMFKGEHDNIPQFVGDCLTYFEAYRHYFCGIPSLMVVFATSHFEGPAQDWWVHQ